MASMEILITRSSSPCRPALGESPRRTRFGKIAVLARRTTDFSRTGDAGQVFRAGKPAFAAADLTAGRPRRRRWPAAVPPRLARIGIDRQSEELLGQRADVDRVAGKVSGLSVPSTSSRISPPVSNPSRPSFESAGRNKCSNSSAMWFVKGSRVTMHACTISASTLPETRTPLRFHAMTSSSARGGRRRGVRALSARPALFLGRDKD